MYKVLLPIADAYVTNRIINNVSQVNSNVGAAGTLDLYKLYGYTSSGSTPNTELTRLLVKFDLSPLKQLAAAGLIDASNPSFSCKLNLFDVYGGQPTPANFSVIVNPLSSSFNEGLGRDVVFYSDFDTCNFLSSSTTNGPWNLPGCALGGTAQQTCDYITASSTILNGGDLTTTQTFLVGDEDLSVDVTTVVSATMAGLLPDVGLRISFNPTLEDDTHTYFVKRFASRTAYNEELRPKLIVRFDDSIQDDTQSLFFDASNYIFLYNYVRSSPANLFSGSLMITGSNSLLLQLQTALSGATYSLYFSGSQHTIGINPAVGIYSASIFLSSTDNTLLQQLQISGSVTFTPIWQSLDRSVPFFTGSALKVYPSQRGTTLMGARNYVVTVLGLQDSMTPNERTVLRVNIFDHTAPYFISAVRLPVELPGVIIRDVHYQVRDQVTQRILIPFDTATNSTRLSNDANGMYFTLDTSNLVSDHSYVIDVMIIVAGNQQIYSNASQPFKINIAA